MRGEYGLAVQFCTRAEPPDEYKSGSLRGRPNQQHVRNEHQQRSAAPECVLEALNARGQ